MGASGQRTRYKRGGQKMVAEINTIIELNPELANLAYEIGLNASKICENALKLAISRLQGVNMDKCLVDEPGFESATSTMPTWQSTLNYFPENTSN
jgi:hypothetical protein